MMSKHDIGKCPVQRTLVLTTLWLLYHLCVVPKQNTDASDFFRKFNDPSVVFGYRVSWQKLQGFRRKSSDSAATQRNILDLRLIPTNPTAHRSLQGTAPGRGQNGLAGA
jgi:hypothetical protein